MILYISQNLIKNHSSITSYNKGLYLYYNDEIISYEIDSLFNTATAIIGRKDPQTVVLTFSTENKQIHSNCTCKKNYGSLCEHSVAMLMETAKRDQLGEFERTRFSSRAASIKFPSW